MSQSLSFAQSRAIDLASTLKVPVILFRTEADDFGVIPAAELDADDMLDIIHEYDPFDFAPTH